MATDLIDRDPSSTSEKSRSDPHERRSSWDPHGSLVSNERTSRHDVPRNRREMLHHLADQYHAEKRRADDAERMLQELTVHLKTINDARLQALHDAAKANEELKLYKIQLRSAQNEIYRAQDVIEAVDRQRYNAEKEAAKSRSKVRRLNETIVMSAAREEAWKLGLQEGLTRGREQSYGGNRFAEEPEALDDEDDSFDETTSSTDAHTFAARPPSFVHNRPSSRTDPSPSRVPVPLPSNLPSNPPTVANSLHPSENIRPMSIRSGYTRPPSRQHTTPAPTPVPLPANPPSSSQSIHPSENVRPLSTRSGYTRPPPRQHVSPSPVPSNTRSNSQYENIRPPSIRPTTPRNTLPPDNFIPSLGPDNKIHIPPPFEFQRAVTPEPPVSPQLPTMSDSSQEALMVPGPRSTAPQQHRKRYHRRHSSSESNSSTFSNLDIINDHPPIGTPMSIIPEVLSVRSTISQLPDGDHPPRHQRSFSQNSTHTLSIPQHIEAPTHLRPQSRSSYAGSTRNGRRQAESHSGNSHASSTPKITVLPPSRPTSMGQWGGSLNASPSPSHKVTLPAVLETHDIPSMSVPGGYHPVTDPTFSPTHSGRYAMNSYTANDDDAVSSGIGTDALTTPLAKGLMSIEPDWSGAIASAGHVPLLPSDSLTGPVAWGLNSSNIDAIMGSRNKGKAKKGK
ncbi:hypothetical protein BYT27DRAFT_7180475 [Phlegmacium glaucopus]|nr:hypothetical protein BYT27DRAFT_7180475 [Phlegmacium glaucopus]